MELANNHPFMSRFIGMARFIVQILYCDSFLSLYEYTDKCLSFW